MAVRVTCGAPPPDTAASTQRYGAPDTCPPTACAAPAIRRCAISSGRTRTALNSPSAVSDTQPHAPESLLAYRPVCEHMTLVFERAERTWPTAPTAQPSRHCHSDTKQACRAPPRAMSLPVSSIGRQRGMRSVSRPRESGPSMPPRQSSRPGGSRWHAWCCHRGWN